MRLSSKIAPVAKLEPPPMPELDPPTKTSTPPPDKVDPLTHTRVWVEGGSKNSEIPSRNRRTQTILELLGLLSCLIIVLEVSMSSLVGYLPIL